MRYYIFIALCLVSFYINAAETQLLIKASAFTEMKSDEQFTYLGEYKFKVRADGRIINLEESGDRGYVAAKYGIISDKAQVKFEFVNSKIESDLFVNDLNIGKIGKGGNLVARSFVFPIGINKMIVKIKNKKIFERNFLINDDGHFKCNYIAEIICEKLSE